MAESEVIRGRQMGQMGWERLEDVGGDDVAEIIGEEVTYVFSYSQSTNLGTLMIHKGADKRLLSVEEAKFLMEELTMSECLLLGVEAGFEHSEGFKAREVQLSALKVKIYI